MRVRELLRIVRTVTNLPNFGNKEETRNWLQGVIETAWTIPGSSLDDVLMNFVDHAVRNNLYDSLYRMLIVCLSTSRALTAEETAWAVRQLEASAKTAGVDPLAVLRVVEDIAAMVQLVRDAASRSSTY